MTKALVRLFVIICQALLVAAFFLLVLLVVILLWVAIGWALGLR